MVDKEVLIVEPPDKQRDSKGRLLPGNTIGNRWVKGQSGNPDGREPKEACLTSLYKEGLAQLHNGTKLTKEQIIAERVVKHLTEKEIDATWLRLLELIQERTEGKVTLPIAGEIETILTVRYDR